MLRKRFHQNMHIDGKISHRMVTREAAAAETLLDLVFRITMLAAPDVLHPSTIMQQSRRSIPLSFFPLVLTPQ